MHEMHKITVITVVYNGADILEKTIQSVIGQSYENIEYIVIDGGSKDGTIDVIKKYESFISEWVSEKDGGIYDAMNKGIRKATGEWINFMNCGDIFSHENVVSDIFKDSYREGESVIYGDVSVVYDTFATLRKAGKLSKFWKGMPFCHQSTFASAALLKQFTFDLSYKLAADFNFFYKIWRLNNHFCYVPFTVANITNNGVSDRAREIVVEEYKRTVLSYNKKLKYLVFYRIYRWKIEIKKSIKVMLGDRLTSFIIKNRAR